MSNPTHRPRRLTEGTVRAAARLILAGATRRQAADGLGVSERVLRSWLAIGRENPDGIYGYLYIAVKRAEASRPALPPETPEERARLDKLLRGAAGFSLSAQAGGGPQDAATGVECLGPDGLPDFVPCPPDEIPQAMRVLALAGATSVKAVGLPVQPAKGQPREPDPDEPAPTPTRNPAMMPPEIAVPKDTSVAYTDAAGVRHEYQFPPEEMQTIIEGLAATGARDAVISGTVNGRRETMPVNPVPAGAKRGPRG